MSSVSLILMLVVSQTSVAREMPRCRSGLISPADDLRTFSLDDYPQERLHRPLALPARVWSLGSAGVYTSRSTAGVATHAGGLVLDANMAPSCNVELGVATGHVLVAPTVSLLQELKLSLTVALTDSVAVRITGSTNAIPQLGIQTASVSLGAPVRIKLGQSIGIVGLEDVLSFWLLLGNGLAISPALVLGLPVGLLFQPFSWGSVEARARPRFDLLSLSFMQFDFQAEVVLSPTRWFDLLIGGWVAPALTSTANTQLNLSLGVRGRL